MQIPYLPHFDWSFKHFGPICFSASRPILSEAAIWSAHLEGEQNGHYPLVQLGLPGHNHPNILYPKSA
jgi:hypothetical protein